MIFSLLGDGAFQHLKSRGVCTNVPRSWHEFGVDQEANTDAVVSHLFTAPSECSFLRSREVSPMRGWFTVALGVQLLVGLVC